MQKICAMGMIEYVEEKWTRREEERKEEKVEKDRRGVYLVFTKIDCSS